MYYEGTDELYKQQVRAPGETPVDSLVIDLDKFHYHEISDRCHVINSMIDDFILSHPACSVLMNSYAVNAQSLICAVMTEAAKEEEKLGR